MFLTNSVGVAQNYRMSSNPNNPISAQSKVLRQNLETQSWAVCSAPMESDDKDGDGLEKKEKKQALH